MFSPIHFNDHPRQSDPHSQHSFLAFISSLQETTDTVQQQTPLPEESPATEPKNLFHNEELSLCLTELANDYNQPHTLRNTLLTCIAKIHTSSGAESLALLMEIENCTQLHLTTPCPIWPMIEGEKKRIQRENIVLIGSGVIYRSPSPSEPTVCLVKASFQYSEVARKVVRVFTAHVTESDKIVGSCVLTVCPRLQDCIDKTYRSKKVLGIIQLDAFGRNNYRGIGTLLMQAAMEYGIINGTEGRIALHSIGNAHGFYHKLGMRNGYKNTVVTDDEIVYLPSDGIIKWRQIIQENPVLKRSTENTP